MEKLTYWCKTHQCTGSGAVNGSEPHRPQRAGELFCWFKAYTWEIGEDGFPASEACDMRPCTVTYGVTADEVREYIGAA